MKFIIDENVPGNIKSMLRKLGHDAFDMSDLNMLSAKNGEIGKKVIESDAILVTLDEDFLQMKKEIKAKIRVIHLHVDPPDPLVAEKLLKSKINSCIGRLRRPGIITLEPE